jgi:hypothetical protein
MPAARLNSSPIRCSEEPTPAEPKFSPPGFALAIAMKSPTVRAPEPGGTTIALGMTVASESGARSASGSKGSFSKRKRFTAIALEVIRR